MSLIAKKRQKNVTQSDSLPCMSYIKLDNKQAADRLRDHFNKQ